MKKRAVIDLGTNTFQLLIGGLTADGKLLRQVNNTWPVQLGKGAMPQGLLQADAMDRAHQALRSFFETIAEHDIQALVPAIGTNILRNAGNAAVFLEDMSKVFPIQAMVISGDQEAHYIFQGILGALPRSFSERALVIDIGGGSTEFILFEGREWIWRKSFELGGLRLLSKFPFTQALDAQQIQNIKTHIEEVLEELWAVVGKHPTKVLMGAAGAFETFLDLELAYKSQIKDPNAAFFPLDVSLFQDRMALVLSKSASERLRIPGMKPFRTEILPFAMLIVQVVMEKLKMTQLNHVEYSLKEGYIFSHPEG